jgi:hypothetical protein
MNMNNQSKAITLLDDVLSRHQKLSESDAFDLPREVRLYASVQALKLERRGDFAGIVELYQEVADKLQSAVKKAPRPYKPLFKSASEFWQAEAKKVEDKMAAQQEQQASVTRVPPINVTKSVHNGRVIRQQASVTRVLRNDTSRPSKEWRNIPTEPQGEGYLSKLAKKTGQSPSRIVIEK